MNRLVRLVWVVAVLVGVLATFYGAYMTFYVVSGVLYSGSTGSEHARFVQRLPRIGHVVLGAWIVGGAAFVINAVAVKRGWWFGTIALCIVLGGLSALAFPRLYRFTGPLGFLSSELRMPPNPSSERADSPKVATRLWPAAHVEP
jgi:hypothetical protein